MINGRGKKKGPGLGKVTNPETDKKGSNGETLTTKGEVPIETKG